MSWEGTVLSVGGGPEQVPAIQAAHRLGFRVVAVDQNPSGAGMQVADVATPCDIADADAVIDVARYHEVKAVIPGPIGRWLTTVGRVNDALGLRGVTAASAEACADKRVMVQRLRDGGVRVADQIAAGSPAEVEAAAGAIMAGGSACVLKPAHGAGSRAVVVAQAGRDPGPALEWHLANRPAGDITVVERFVTGTELGVDAAVVGGRVQLILLRAREQTPLPYRLQLVDVAPAALPGATVAAVTAELNRAVGALGLVDCLFHADLAIEHDTEVSVLELSGRPAGAHVPDAIIPAVTGVKVLEEGLKLVLGQPASFAPRQLAGAARRFLPIPAGRVLRAGPPPTAATHPGVLVFECPLKGGERLGPLATVTDAMARGMVVTTGPDAAGARRLADEIVATLDVEVEAPTIDRTWVTSR
jgi:biotin carboxylase